MSGVIVMPGLKSASSSPVSSGLKLMLGDFVLSEVGIMPGCAWLRFSEWEIGTLS